MTQVENTISVTLQASADMTIGSTVTLSGLTGAQDVDAASG